MVTMVIRQRKARAMTRRSQVKQRTLERHLRVPFCNENLQSVLESKWPGQLSTAISYGPDGLGIECRWGGETCPGAHQGSGIMGTRSLSRG
jgi:hypothetical protein